LASIGDSDTTKANAVRSALTAAPNPGDANYNASVSIPDLIQWVREGWAVNTTYSQFRAAHDGTWMGAVQSPSNTFNFSAQPVVTISEFPAVYTLVSSNTGSSAIITATLLAGEIMLGGTTAVAMVSGTAEFTNLVLTAPRGASGVVQFSAPNHLSITGSLSVAPRFKFNGIAKNAIIRTSPGR
jgi:hypothetical protein